MESQPQNPEFRNNPENFHPCFCCIPEQALNCFPCFSLPCQTGYDCSENEKHFLFQLFEF